MAFYANNEQLVTLQAPVAATTARNLPWFKMPRPGTIKNAYMSTSNGVATANTTTAFAPSLMNGGQAGTSTLTVATWGTLATAYVQTAGFGYAAGWTPDTTAKDFATGEWVVWREEVTGTPSTALVSAVAHVVMGTGRTSSTT